MAVGLCCLVASLGNHVRMLAYPGPQEVNEAAAYYCTRLLSTGRNPYAPEEVPAAMQFFGPLYNQVVLLLEPLLGADYVAHRLVSALCLAGGLVLLGRHMRRSGASWGFVLAALSVLYCCCLENIMITARPDALGWLFFLASLLWPAERDYAPGASVLRVIFAVLAFQCKAYFGVAVGATLLGVAWRRSPARAVRLGVLFLVLAGLSVRLTAWRYPLYPLEAFVLQYLTVRRNMSDGFVGEHALMLLARGWPFLLLLLGGAAAWLARRVRRRRREGADVPWTQGWRAKSPTEVLAVVLCLFFIPVHFWMGRNGGATFTYHLQLLFPLLLVLSARVGRGGWRIGATALLAVFAGFSCRIHWAPSDTAPYNRLCQLIRSEPGEIMAGSWAVAPLWAVGKPVYDDGFTPYAPYLMAPSIRSRFRLAQVVYDRYEAQRLAIWRKVETRQFALFLTEGDDCSLCDIELLREHYRVVERFECPTYFGQGPIWVWRPKPE